MFLKIWFVEFFKQKWKKIILVWNISTERPKQKPLSNSKWEEVCNGCFGRIEWKKFLYFNSLKKIFGRWLHRSRLWQHLNFFWFSEKTIRSYFTQNNSIFNAHKKTHTYNKKISNGLKACIIWVPMQWSFLVQKKSITKLNRKIASICYYNALLKIWNVIYTIFSHFFL